MKKSPVLAGCVPCMHCRGAGETRRSEFSVLRPFAHVLRSFQGPSWLPKVLVLPHVLLCNLLDVLAQSACMQAPELQGAAVGTEVVPRNASRGQGYRELPRRPAYVAEHGVCCFPTATSQRATGIGAFSSSCSSCTADEAAQRRLAVLRSMTKQERRARGIEEVLRAAIVVKAQCIATEQLQACRM